MKLSNGVTGFYNTETNKPPQVDGKQFKQLCFEFAFQNGGRVLDFQSPHYPSNFYYAQVEILGTSFYILLNEHYPYLAIASNVEYGNLNFIDRPVLHEKFSEFYHVLDTNKLNAPLNKNLFTELNSKELEQIAYWNPENIGQIIFNYWD